MPPGKRLIMSGGRMWPNEARTATPVGWVRVRSGE